MRQKVISFLLALCMVASIFPSVNVSAADIPSDELIETRIYELNDLIGGTYFNTEHSETSCGKKSRGHGCEKCKVNNVIASKWFKDIFGTVKPSQLFSNGSMSCMGFVQFAAWYIFRADDSDTVLNDKSKMKSNLSFDYDNVKANAHIGDYLWLKSGHAVIFISCDQNGIKVLDSNFNGNYNCMVSIHTIPYSSYKSFSVCKLYSKSRGSDSTTSYGITAEIGKQLPQNFTLSTDKGTYTLGETVTITPSAENTTHYAISVWKGSFSTGNRQYVNYRLPGGITFTPTETGVYTIRADAKNATGYVSKERTFEVVDNQAQELPKNLVVSTDKNTYTLGESVHITPSADNTTRYSITVWLGAFETGKRVYKNYYLYGGTTFTPEETGDYTIRVDAINDAGYISKEKTFEVIALPQNESSDGLPSNLSIALDREIYTLGETVTITPSANNITHYAISVWNGPFNAGERQYVNYRLPGGITFTPSKIGTYTVRVDAKNGAGYISGEKKFTVIAQGADSPSGDLPTGLTISTDRETYAAGDTVTITPSANNITHYAISVWRGAFGSGERLYVNYRLSEGITFTPSKAGTYTIRVDAKNANGYISTERIFIVSG